MNTVNREFADQIARTHGDGDLDAPFKPPITRVIEYANAWGNLAYGVTHEGQDQDVYLRATDFIINPRIFWERISK
jgi:hypothetical protein